MRTWIGAMLVALAVALGGCADEGTAPVQSEAEPEAGCHPSYPSDCLNSIAEDYDCEDGTGDEPEYVTGPVEVDWNVEDPDPFDLDRDQDGTACGTLAY